MNKLETHPYKGVRDFYPEDQFIQNHIFSTWRKVVESFGYVEYAASILEPSELYRAKTGEEIVSEQTYSFVDRGEREVTLRPELTPTLARMVAARRRELALPIRWYSIPNLFRYESPQRGRLREHWQLNVDLFGVKGIAADAEIIEIAATIMKEFGAQESDFLIRINSRKIVNKLYDLFGLSADGTYALSKLIDKKGKMAEAEFDAKVRELVGEEADKFILLLNAPDKLLEKIGQDSPEVQEILTLSSHLAALGITNVTFDLSLMRGFDYYTGIVFEIFDTHPENKRSLFGGGRYDELLDIFGEEKISAFGFGTGDVITRDFLEIRDLLPKYAGTAQVAILPLENRYFLEAAELRDKLREASIATALDSSERKIGDKVKAADRQSIKYVIAVGEEESSSKTYKLKNLESGEETAGPVDLLVLELQKISKDK